MANKRAQFTIKGMSRDLAVSKFNPEFAFENKNLRLIATDDNTTFSIVNEKGNVEAPIVWDAVNGLPIDIDYITGIPVGQCVINDALVLFSTGEKRVNIPAVAEGELEVPYDEEEHITITKLNADCIYKFWFEGDVLHGLKLFDGNLNLAVEHPIETLGIYENDKLQKVYWTDGNNQPRYINIAADIDTIKSWNNASFDFIGALEYGETINIEKNYVSSGLFAPGTIQYCFTYYDMYGRQTNIFYTSPLYYISFTDRGANPSETISNSFTIKIGKPDTKYSKIRIYSLQRTSINTTPIVKVVGDISISNIPIGNTAILVDNGMLGFTIDPTDLLYIGGKELIAGSLAQKDNTLFLGNLSTKTNTLPKWIRESIRSWESDIECTNNKEEDAIYFQDSLNITGYYLYESQLKYNSQQISGFKFRDWYRLGVQFQDRLGNWSEVCYITDKEINVPPTFSSGEGAEEESRSVLHPTRLSLAIEDSEITRALLIMGYVKARPVIVYPTLTDRACICQGVVNPTVFNAEDRYNNAPFAQASWFFRPNAPVQINSQGPTQEANYGKWAEFRHLHPIPGCRELNSEIQCISFTPEWPELYASTKDHEGRSYVESGNPKIWAQQNKECYFVDQSIVTLNSPDIEFDKELNNLDYGNLKFRITGTIGINSSISDIEIQTSTPSLQYCRGKSGDTYSTSPLHTPGFYKETIGTKLHTDEGNTHGWKSILSGIFWLDELYKSSANNTYNKSVGFVIYPWHRGSSLNNTVTVGSDETMSALLDKKKLSILRYSTDTNFFATENDSLWPNYNNLDTYISLYNSDENIPIKIKHNVWKDYSRNEQKILVLSNEYTYKGNIDKLQLFHIDPKAFRIDGDPSDITSTIATYPIIASRVESPQEASGSAAEEAETNNFRSTPEVLFDRNYGTLRDYVRRQNHGEISYRSKSYVTDDVPGACNDGVLIKYKSTPHAVISFNGIIQQSETKYNASALPVIKQKDGNDYLNQVTWTSRQSSKHRTSLIWDEHCKYSGNDTINVKAPDVGFLYQGEIYRDIDTSTIFGGNTEEAIENNTWIIGGPAIFIPTEGTQTLKWCEGDTFYQRYDCLKTYPFTMSDVNSVVDILSFMCETRVNIDGRYDRNRGLTSNLYASPENFNLINSVYSQRNNFFTYRSISPDKLVLDKYPNLITWTKTKSLGEEIDSWTNVTLAASLDLDGDKGQITALKVFNNTLLAFQDTGVSQILYNDNVQIASTTGIPIEIASSGKVSGKRYISNQVGCSNKWSICTAPTGIYFVDDRTKDIFVFNGQIDSLSDKLGFRSWLVQNFKDIKIWNPKDFDGIVTYYDPINQDVLFISKNSCLAFNEILGQFSSFYSYEHVPYFSSLKNRIIAWQTMLNEDHYRPWLHHEGDYNKFFGMYKPFWTTVIVNPDNTDKIFNTIEFRADSFNINKVFIDTHTFDHLRTWNEYQEGVCELVNTADKPSTLKKKFRVWHANIPRWNVDKNGQLANNRDRMRNPWLYLKLSMENLSNLNSNYKTVLHDLAVDYTE